MLRQLLSRTLSIIAVSSVLLTGSAESLAGDGASDGDGKGKAYSGAFLEPEIYLGGETSPRTDSPGFVLNTSLRHSFVFLLGDTRLSYELREPGTQRTRHGLWLHGCVHPLAAFLLGSDWLRYVIASLYFEIGLGGLVHASTGDVEATSPALGWSWGSGLDVPLGDADRGDLPWLHLVFRRSFDVSNSKGRTPKVRDDAFLLGLGWRFNGGLF